MNDIVDELRAQSDDLTSRAASEIERLRHASGVWRFDANRRSFGYWVSDIGALDPGFAETGPWIEYRELHPKMWAPLPACPVTKA